MARLLGALSACAWATLVILTSTPAGAEMPGPGVREQEWSLAAAYRSFERGRYEQALAAFEAAAREGSAAPTPETLRRWGIAASEAGWHLTAFIRLGQFLEREPGAADREVLAARLARSRDALVAGAARRSRVMTTSERRPDYEGGSERLVVRLAARDRRATLEALAGFRIQSPLWERAGEVPLPAYLDLMRRLLDAPALRSEIPSQSFDPNAPGPRRAVTLRLVIGDEEWSLQALRGDPFERLNELTAWIVEFARTVAMVPPTQAP
jgi:hypothetical protein